MAKKNGNAMVPLCHKCCWGLWSPIPGDKHGGRMFVGCQQKLGVSSQNRYWQCPILTEKQKKANIRLTKKLGLI